MVDNQLTGKKIICRVWNNKHDKVLAKKKVAFGTPYFNVKIGKRKRTFKINYAIDGCIKQDGSIHLYDTVFDNAVGALAFHSFSKHEVMSSDETYEIFEHNAVKMYVSKGGIPLIYLAVCMIAVLAMAFAVILTVPAGIQSSEEREELDQLVTALRQENAVLKQQIQVGGQ